MRCRGVEDAAPYSGMVVYSFVIAKREALWQSVAPKAERSRPFPTVVQKLKSAPLKAPLCKGS